MVEVEKPPQREEEFVALLATTYADGDERKARQVMDTIKREEERRRIASQFRAFLRIQSSGVSDNGEASTEVLVRAHGGRAREAEVGSDR